MKMQRPSMNVYKFSVSKTSVLVWITIS